MEETTAKNEEFEKLDNLDNYQLFVRSTKVYSQEFHLVYPILGLVNEAGEVAGKVKKLMRDDNGQLTQERFEDIISELGDVLWYVTAIADDLGVALTDIFMQNYLKISDRSQRGVIKGSGDVR